jgi:hypothetical protein
MGHSKLFIADEPMGFCGGCGIALDVGNWVAIRQGVACHAKTCSPRPRATPQPEPEPAMLLFDDGPLETIEAAKATVNATRIAFDGASARPIDTLRLAGQLQKVFELMKDGRYRTLSTIAESVGCLETSASARLRDFRKARNGGHDVAVRYIGVGVNEYRLILRGERDVKDGQRAA